eukprot:1159804-Pelagomonas_calceolata.AAC.2
MSVDEIPKKDGVQCGEHLLARLPGCCWPTLQVLGQMAPAEALEGQTHRQTWLMMKGQVKLEGQLLAECSSCEATFQEKKAAPDISRKVQQGRSSRRTGQAGRRA